MVVYDNASELLANSNIAEIRVSFFREAIWLGQCIFLWGNINRCVGKMGRNNFQGQPGFFVNIFLDY